MSWQTKYGYWQYPSTILQRSARRSCRYFISDEKLAALGWKEKTSWEEGLEKTIQWYTGKNIDSYWAPDDIEKALQPHPVL